MKIAILNQPQDPIVAGEEQRGSVAIVNWELARRLSRRHEVTVYAPAARGQPSFERWENIQIRRARFTARGLHKPVQLIAGRFGGRRPYAYSFWYYREYYWQIARDLRARSVDIIHFPVQIQFAGLFRAAVPNAKRVLHMHQDEMAQLDEGFLRRHLRDIDSVVTVSDFVTNRARERFPELSDRIHTIGNGVDIDRFRPHAGDGGSKGTTRLMFVGRISPDKGVHLLFEAFNRVARERSDLELTVVGKPGMMPLDVLGLLLNDDAALESVREFYGRSILGWLTKEVLGQRHSYIQYLRTLLSADVTGRVHFRGTVPLPELIRLYSEAALLVLPSIWQESYGLPVAEAMASGVPVLASRSGGVPELVEEGVTGRLVPRCDVDALTGALYELLADPASLRQMGQAARARAERLLTWERSAQRLENIYLRGTPE